MANKPQKKKEPIKVNEFDMDKFFEDEGLTTVVKDKELSWIPFSPAYHEALGIPGVAKGYITIFKGYSNTGKSTAAYETMAACQKLGIVPVFIDTENNFTWEHAKNVGVQYEEVINEETGEVENFKGFFKYINNDALIKKYGNIDYSDGTTKKERRTEAVIEDVARFMDELLDAQANGKFPYELCFIWDSVGTLNCNKSVKSKSANNQWNAGAMDTAFKAIINHKIPASRKEDKEFTNTFVCINKIWLDAMQGAGVVKLKGGESLYSAARMIIHFGGVNSHGTGALKATSGGREYIFGIHTKVKCEKNHINGIEWEGKIASSVTGFMNPEKKNEYVKENKKLLLTKLGVSDGEIDVTEEKNVSDLF